MNIFQFNNKEDQMIFLTLVKGKAILKANMWQHTPLLILSTTIILINLFCSLTIALATASRAVCISNKQK